MVLSYLDKNWKTLTVHVEGKCLRPFAIGRKNWIFSNSQNGAKTSSMLYSIIETSKSNDLNPHAYLQLLLVKMPQV